MIIWLLFFVYPFSHGQSYNDSKIEKCFSNIYEKHHEFTPITVTCPLSLERLGCYHYENSNIIRKGCVSELTNDQRTECAKNGENCKICFGKQCNYKNTFEKCASCDSSVDLNCISPDDSTPLKQCHEYNDKCFTFTDGFTVKRDCVENMNELNSKKCHSNNEQCKICFSSSNGQICNDQPIEDVCVHCDSHTESDCERSPETLKEYFCSVKSSPDGCFLSKYEDVVVRGCLGDLTYFEKRNCLSLEEEGCQNCFGKSCNKRIEFNQKCYFCSGPTDERCSNLSGKKEIITCPNYSSSCLIGIDANGFIHRRCSSYKTFDQFEFPKGFELCFSDLCNDKVIANTVSLL